MSVVAAHTRLNLLQGLKRYSKAEVELLNGFATVFRDPSDWRTWLKEGLGCLLEVPGKRAIVLQQTNQIEGGEQQELVFEKDTVTFGRDPNNDVVIALPAVGRRHAQVIKQGGDYFLEDLGSANGTYLNDVKLDSLTPTPLNDGAQFAIFPHQFAFASEQLWNQVEHLRVSGGSIEPAVWNPRRVNQTSAFQFFSIRLSPGVGSALLGVSEDFLKAIVQRIGRGAAVTRILPSDMGLFEFLMLSVMVRANQDVQFPYRFSLEPFEPLAENEAGIALECSISLAETTGVVGLFLPECLLKAIQRSEGARECQTIPVSWPIFATGGHCDLSLDEMTGLETGDILLITPALGLLLPATASKSECGWTATAIEEAPQRLRIEQYFERSELLMNSPIAAGSGQGDAHKPDLATLPVRVHVVLSQLQMTLAELNKLTPGTIVELDQEKPEAVQLAVNGKIVGVGELVEIDGRLGVRIVNWATP